MLVGSLFFSVIICDRGCGGGRRDLSCKPNKLGEKTCNPIRTNVTSATRGHLGAARGGSPGIVIVAA